MREKSKARQLTGGGNPIECQFAAQLDLDEPERFPNRVHGVPEDVVPAIYDIGEAVI